MQPENNSTAASITIVSFVLCIDVVFVVLHIVDAKGGQILQIMERFLFVGSVGLFVEVMI